MMEHNRSLTPGELRKQTAKGGIVSGIARRRQVDMREWLKHYLSLTISQGPAADLSQITDTDGVSAANTTVGYAMGKAVTDRAMAKGDPAAFLAILKAIGQDQPQPEPVNPILADFAETFKQASKPAKAKTRSEKWEE